MSKLPEAIVPQDLYVELSQDNPPLVLDVREPWEQELRPFKGAVCIPLGSLENHLTQLDTQRSIAAICLSGRRSNTACYLLQRAGFAKVRNLEGGMNAWDAFLEERDLE